VVGEGGQARELEVDGLGEREGVEGGPEVLEVGHSHGNSLGAGLDALEGRLRTVVHAMDPGTDALLADELHGRQEQVLEEPQLVLVEGVQGGHGRRGVVPDGPPRVSGRGSSSSARCARCHLSCRGAPG